MDTDAAPGSGRSKFMFGFAQLANDLPVISKVLIAHGIADICLPNNVTALPLARVLDTTHRSKKKRGWAWLYMMLGGMKIRSAFGNEVTQARIAGSAYFWQALTLAMEGFYHASIPRASKVLGSTIAFCAFMFAWLQMRAKWNGEPQVEDSVSSPALAPGTLPSAPPADGAKVV
ncbi:unnamed protein product [Symbiodinium sp. CCMP2456]|nr:unnamed protein product [Symbiodinium sp. CCMP2456]